MSPRLWLFTLFGTIGMAAEVCFTALLDLVRTRRLRLHGFSFIWMFPIYGLLSLLLPPVARLVEDLPWTLRGLTYMAGIYLVEFVTGTLLTALTGSHIWQYTDRFNYKGQITLWYAPVWFSLGLVVEQTYPWAEAVSRALARIPA